MALVIYIVIESTLLFLGLGFSFDLVLANSPQYQATWLVIIGTGLVGLSLGLLFAWQAAQIFTKSLATFWLWLYSLATAWLIGAIIFYWQANSPDAIWQPVAMAITFGTVPGLLLGAIFTWKAPTPFRKQTIAATTLVNVAPVIFDDPPTTRTPLLPQSENFATSHIPALPEFQNSSATNSLPASQSSQAVANRAALRAAQVNEAFRLRQTMKLSKELKKLEQLYKPSQSQLVELENGELVVILNVSIYLGNLSFYIVCDESYPRQAPKKVHVEVVRSNTNATIELPYDTHLLNQWHDDYSLETIVKDAILQVEEALI